jgi:hypothetical protein
VTACQANLSDLGIISQLHAASFQVPAPCCEEPGERGMLLSGFSLLTCVYTLRGIQCPSHSEHLLLNRRPCLTTRS